VAVSTRTSDSVVSSGSSSVSAPCDADTTAWSKGLVAASVSTPAAAARMAATRSSGWASKVASTTAEKVAGSRSTIASASADLEPISL